MTDQIPEGYISLTEAFQRYWSEHTGDSGERAEWERHCPDIHEEYLNAMKEAFASGKLKALVWRTGRKTESVKVIIEQDDWREAKDVSDLFLYSDVFAFQGSPLGKYLGRRPFVKEADFQSWLDANGQPNEGNASPIAATKKPERVDELALSKWFERRVKTWPRDEPYPSSDDDWSAAKRAFPDATIPRQLMRDIRTRITPAMWRRQGRRSPR